MIYVLSPEDLAQFSEEARRTLVLAFSYQNTRREFGQKWYSIFREAPTSELETDEATGPDAKQFRTFNTVRQWIEEGGWTIRWEAAHWQGYVKFVFERVKPTVPQPGQLKNGLLLKEYLTTIPKQELPPPQRNAEQLREMYGRIVEPSIAPFVDDFFGPVGG